MMHDDWTTATTTLSTLTEFRDEQQSSVSWNQDRLSAEFQLLRRKEIVDLQVAMKDLETHSHSRLFWVSGESGVGKTSLILDALTPRQGDPKSGTQDQTKDDFLFVTGKFDPSRQRCEPYSAIMEALMDLNGFLLHPSGPNSQGDSSDTTSDDLNSILSELSTISMKESKADSTDASKRFQSFAKFKLLCRRFLQSVKSRVVFFLDDLQWADESSLGVLESLLSDRESKGIFFVGAYRSDEVEKNSMLKGLIQKTIKGSEDSLVASSYDTFILAAEVVSVQPFNLKDVDRIVKAIVQPRDSTGVLDLSELVWKRTNGNAYFVIQFLEMLGACGLLLESARYGSVPDFQMEWDIEQIKRETNLCDNVADVVIARIQRLPDQVQQVLRTASFLGHRIHTDVLLTVLNQDQERPQDRKKAKPHTLSTQLLDEMLDIGCKEGIIEALSRTHHNVHFGGREAQFKFTHDRVQSVLYEIHGDEDQRDLQHLQIGRVLWSMFMTTSDEWFMSLSAYHLNFGSKHITSEEERFDLFLMNLDVANLAMSRSAFTQAFEYLEFGLSLFSDDFLWERHFQVTLDIMSTVAEAYFCSGRLSKSREAIAAIMDRTTSTCHRMRAYFVLVELLAAERNIQERHKVAFSVLKELGETFPKRVNKLHVVVEFLKVRRLMVGQDPREFLLNLPLMNDSSKRAAMNLLSSIGTTTFMNDAEKLTFGVVGLRLMRLTLTHGMNEWSPCGIACYAIALAALGRFEDACNFGRIAMEASDKLGKRQNEVRHMLYMDHLVFHWKRPLHEGLDSFLDCYERSMRNGDIDTGLCATVGYIATMSQCNVSLHHLEEYCRLFVLKMHEFNHHAYLSIILPMWQVTLNMLGRSEDPLVLNGEAMEYESFRKGLIAEKNIVGLEALETFHLKLAEALCDTNRMEQCLSTLQSKTMSTKVHFAEYLAEDIIGSSCFALYREKRRAKYYRRGCKTVRKMRRWANAGVVNCVGFLMLFEARKMSSKNRANYTDLKKSFDEAILWFTQNGFLSHEAVTNEQAGLVALKHGRKRDATSYMLRAWQLNEKYGYRLRADALKARYPELLEASVVSDSVSAVHDEKGFE